MDPAVIVFLMAAGFVAAFIDSVVGGGGIITLPALLAAGLAPHDALGTNKLAASGASGVATWQYARHGALVPGLVALLVPLSFLGSVLGAAAVLQVPGEWVRALVIVVVGTMTLFVLLRPRFGMDDRYPGFQWRGTGPLIVLALAIGFYDGFLGPGTGSMLLFGLVGLAGLGFLRAAAHGRVMNFASNVAALIYFALQGHVVYAVGLPMLAAMLVGGYVGSRFGIRHGAKWVRWLFVAMSAALALRLLWDLAA